MMNEAVKPRKGQKKVVYSCSALYMESSQITKNYPDEKKIIIIVHIIFASLMYNMCVVKRQNMKYSKTC